MSFNGFDTKQLRSIFAIAVLIVWVISTIIMPLINLDYKVDNSISLMMSAIAGYLFIDAFRSKGK